jgi:hypothetical protein
MKLEMQQMMEILLAKIDTKMEAIRAETKPMQDTRMEANRNVWWKERTPSQETTEARLECEEPNSADMKACQETTARHGATEADTEKIEPNPGMMQSVGDHQEVPKGEATMMPVRGLRKWSRDQNLAAGCCQNPKGRIQASCESRKRLTVAGKRMTSCEGGTWLR